MLKFMSFAVKLQLNVHDLNNEAVAGNVSDIRIIEFLDEKGKRKEAPAVSGRMLKHWHQEAMRNLIDMNQMCDGCKSGEPIRPGKIENGQLKQESKSEKEAINSCAICDVHGFLIAKGAETEGETGISSRRTSRVMFSWLMPILETETVSKQVIHNRVSSNPEYMMPFYKSYASGIYAFVSVLDIDRIGLVELNLSSSNANQISDRTNRIKAAIEAYRLMISGQMGASLSHAIPHSNPIDILVVYSKQGPLPFPVSPIYSDYLKKTMGIMPDHAQTIYWGDNPDIDNKIKTVSIDEIFKKLIEEVNKQ